MTFYFKPPRGNIPLHQLEECVNERLRYLAYVHTLNDLSQCDEYFNFEYLTDGSALDRTGHFMLRLDSLKDFILSSETLLFEKRLNSLKPPGVYNAMRTALRHTREVLSQGVLLPKFKQFLDSFQAFLTKLLMRSTIDHIFHHNHSQKCGKFKFQVPFTMCLQLVASKNVELYGGLAEIPCGKISQFLSSLFLEHMKCGLEQFSSSVSYKSACDDDRVKFIARALRPYFRKQFHSSGTVLCGEIDDRSSYFPPCMRSLHHTLRQRHRLSHDSRYFYSLFLKDIGMTLAESVQFWRQEYLQPHLNCGSCTHSWQKDGQRYLYSIRHMYGLEGSHREYHIYSCKQLQSLSLTPSAEGGCPFIHFDKEKLISSLHQEVKSKESVVAAILSVCKEGASLACHFYHKILDCLLNGNLLDMREHQSTVQNDFIFRNPNEFYVTLDSIIKAKNM